MDHVFEAAVSGRSKCRGCGRLIRRGELRFGERLANLFGDGEMTLWFHPQCAAYKRPEPLLQALDAGAASPPDRTALAATARHGLLHRRLRRIDGVERAPSSQASCRCCRQRIERGSWRIRLVFYEEGMFSPGGYVHLTCRRPYFEASEILEQLLHFSVGLSEGERAELVRAYALSEPADAEQGSGAARRSD